MKCLTKSSHPMFLNIENWIQIFIKIKIKKINFDRLLALGNKP